MVHDKGRRAWGVFAAVGGGIAAISIVALAARSSGRRASPPNKRIALIGDSYAVGLGPELEKRLPEFRYEGHVGIGTAAWATRAPACGPCGDWLAAFRPALVLVALGVNDGKSPNSSNYQAIVRELHGIGARVLWIEPPAGVSAAAARAAIEGLGVDVVPGLSLPLGSDGLHPVSYGPWSAQVADVANALVTRA